jgi:hypothetical protein
VPQAMHPFLHEARGWIGGELGHTERLIMLDVLTACVFA